MACFCISMPTQRTRYQWNFISELILVVIPDCLQKTNIRLGWYLLEMVKKVLLLSIKLILLKLWNGSWCGLAFLYDCHVTSTIRCYNDPHILMSWITWMTAYLKSPIWWINTMQTEIVFITAEGECSVLSSALISWK